MAVGCASAHSRVLDPGKLPRQKLANSRRQRLTQRRQPARNGGVDQTVTYTYPQPPHQRGVYVESEGQTCTKLLCQRLAQRILFLFRQLGGTCNFGLRRRLLT